MLNFLRLAGVATIFTCGSVAAGEAAAEVAWPQWRGPTRDGIAAPGPKLLDSWPANGPTLAWKTETARAEHVEGGMSSPVVAEGRVVIYAHTRGTGKPVVLVTSETLKNWGWAADMPNDLAENLERYRRTRDHRARSDIQTNAFVEGFLKTLPADQAKKYEEVIWNRLALRHPIRLPVRDNDYVHTGIPTWKDVCGFVHLLDKSYATLIECWKDIEKHVGWTHKDDSWMFTQMLAEAFPPFDTVICLDAASGRPLWRKDFPGDCRLGLGFQFWSASATPAIAKGRCYVQGSAGFYCLSLNDGSVVWKTRSNFSHSSPLVMGGMVYAMTPWLTAFNADTGKILWIQEKVKASWEATSVVPWVNDGKTWLVTVSGNGPCGIDPADGKPAWDTTKNRIDSAETPVMVGDVLLAARTAMKLTPRGGEKLWSVNAGGDRGSSVTCYQGMVYAHGGRGPFCFDLKTGEQKWKGPGDYDGECHSAILADGKLIGLWGAKDGREVVMYRASPEKYEQLGRFKLNNAYGSSPAIADGRLFVRTDDGVACFDLTK